MSQTGYHAEVGTIVRDSLLEIIQFVGQPAFVGLMEELYGAPPGARAGFVSKVLLREEERRARGLTVPPGLTIQRSTFGDGRPTLFCVSKRLPDGLPHGWYKVTVTFDNEGNTSSGAVAEEAAMAVA